MFSHQMQSRLHGHGLYSLCAYAVTDATQEASFLIDKINGNTS